MISLFAPWTWCSSEAESWVLTMMAYCVHGFRGRMRYPGSCCSFPSVARGGGSTSAITQLLEPHASWPSNSVTFLYGLEEQREMSTILRNHHFSAMNLIYKLRTAIKWTLELGDVLNAVKMKTRRKYRKHSLFNLVWTIKLAKHKTQTSLQNFQWVKCSGFWTVLLSFTASILQNSVNKLSMLIKLHIKSQVTYASLYKTMNPRRSRKSGGQKGSHLMMILSESVRICVNFKTWLSPSETTTNMHSDSLRKRIRAYMKCKATSSSHEAWSPLVFETMSFFVCRFLVPVTSSIFRISDMQSFELWWKNMRPCLMVRLCLDQSHSWRRFWLSRA